MVALSVLLRAEATRQTAPATPLVGRIEQRHRVGARCASVSARWALDGQRAARHVDGDRRRHCAGHCRHGDGAAGWIARGRKRGRRQAVVVRRPCVTSRPPELAENITGTPFMNWLLALRTRALICAGVAPSDGMVGELVISVMRCHRRGRTAAAAAALRTRRHPPPPQAASASAMQGRKNSMTCAYS